MSEPSKRSTELAEKALHQLGLREREGDEGVKVLAMFIELAHHEGMIYGLRQGQLVIDRTCGESLFR